MMSQNVLSVILFHVSEVKNYCSSLDKLRFDGGYDVVGF
jgi:hypothetical protein